MQIIQWKCVPKIAPTEISNRMKKRRHTQTFRLLLNAISEQSDKLMKFLLAQTNTIHTYEKQQQQQQYNNTHTRTHTYSNSISIVMVLKSVFASQYMNLFRIDVARMKSHTALVLHFDSTLLNYFHPIVHIKLLQ